MAAVTPPDLEAWLVSYLRQTLTADGIDVEVDNKEPAALTAPLSAPLIVVRDDSGPQESVITYNRQVGISVLAGSHSDDEPARDLSRKVMSIAADPDIALAQDSPIAAVDLTATRGPWAIDEAHDVARRYMTVGYTVVGTWN